MNINMNICSQRGRWERGQSPVGCDCYHTIITPISVKNLFILIDEVIK